MKKYLIRIRRYLLFLMQYLLYEKPWGLDFTMRNTAIYERSNGKCHSIEESLRKDVNVMCNLSQGIEEKGIAIGKAMVNYNNAYI